MSGSRGDVSGNGDDNFPSWLMQPRDNSGYNLNNRIMIAAIVSLSVVVILVALLHIYARYVLRRQAQRRAAIRQLGLMNAIQLQARGELPKTGLEPSVLAVLPIVSFKRRVLQGGDESTSTEECTVCLSVLEEGELTRCLPNCKHVFHAECIDRWFGSHTTCPVCRTEAEPRVQMTMGGTAIDAAPTAPPVEGTSESGLHPSAKVSGSSSRLTSFRRMLSRERSSVRMASRSRSDDAAEDPERQ